MVGCRGSFQGFRLKNRLDASIQPPTFSAIRLPGAPVSLVYFIEAIGAAAVKIGTAADLKKRLNTLQTASPMPLRVLGTTPGGRDAEQTLHRRFAHLKLRGEWFRAEPELLSFIRDIGSPSTIAPIYGALDVDSLFLGLLGHGYRRSFYKAFVRTRHGEWWKFETGAYAVNYDPIDRQARIKKPTRVVQGRLVDAAGYKGKPDNQGLLNLLVRAAELTVDTTLTKFGDL